MKTLMMTTALVTASAFGAMAQTAMPEAQAPAGAHGSVPAFLASDFTGKTLYTLDSEDARAIRDDGQADAGAQAMAERDQLRWTSSDTFLADRDNWEDVGAIDDIVMTMDGDIRGVLLDIGGFLGFGARTVMIDIEDLYFVSDDSDPEEIGDFSVVISMTEEELEALPEWDEDMLQAGFETRSYGADDHQDMGAMDDMDGMDQEQQAAADEDREVFTERHTMIEGEDRTAERLMGASVYDAEGENVGSVDDIVLDDDNAISGLLVDVGGFLGIGAHTVNLPADEVRIGWDDQNGDVRVQVAMTADQLEEMPEHEN